MTDYTAPTDDIRFVLHDFLQIETQDGFEEIPPDFTTPALQEAAKFAKNIAHPLNAIGDTLGCTLKNGKIQTPEGFKSAFDTYKAGGWNGLDCDPQFGGQGLPYILQIATGEIFSAANMALAMYPGLTHAAYSAIHRHGTEAQKALFLPKLIDLQWCGTMNLTEPHCGTDLGLLRTKATPQKDGTYQLTGQKIFISSGDHDLAENIIHLVLARLPDAPKGVKGVSLFIVPKFTINDDGSLGDQNGVTVGRIENKMGIHGNATCEMNYEGAVGTLLGQENKGLRAMFVMMNEARMAVGMQGLGLAEIAHQNALEYARTRHQGRAVGAKADAPAEPLTTHPDVRRMLMNQKTLIEGGRGFLLYAAMLMDKAEAGDAAAQGLAGLLTPIIKAFLTDIGFDLCVSAQQIYGGHGYIEDNGMSQFVRDARITMIYEGANGVQALDLVGRKLAANNGADVMAFLALGQGVVAECEACSARADLAEPLRDALAGLQQVMAYFMKSAERPNAVLAGSVDTLHLFGYTAVAVIWAQMAGAAVTRRETGELGAAFYDAKLASARYYMTRVLPAVEMHKARAMVGEVVNGEW